jgi:hypothetical protein
MRRLRIIIAVLLLVSFGGLVVMPIVAGEPVLGLCLAAINLSGAIFIAIIAQLEIEPKRRWVAWRLKPHNALVSALLLILPPSIPRLEVAALKGEFGQLTKPPVLGRLRTAHSRFGYLGLR